VSQSMKVKLKKSAKKPISTVVKRLRLNEAPVLFPEMNPGPWFPRRSDRSVDENGNRKPRLLDLFCCAGGAAIGYSRAGFEVVGVDIKPQPHYPLQFIQADALALDPEFIASFDAIHASPPCQSYSDLAKRNGNADAWPRLVDPVRDMLVRSGLPYVIENVEGAPLNNPTILCGTMFKGLRVLRHRLFETNFRLVTPVHGKHPKVHTFDKRKSQFGKTDEMRDFVSVNGGGNCTVAAASDAMGIDWMTKNELNEAIPPVYTQFIGEQLLLHIARRAVHPALLPTAEAGLAAAVKA
jgi:DNA (cytosine-5)-methyltransferase 1